MAYPNPSPHLKIQWSGGLGPTGAPVEIWSFGLSAAGTLGSGLWLSQSVEELETLAEALVAPWQVFGTQMSSSVRLNRVRVAAIGTEGKVMRTAEGAYRQGDAVANSPGNGGHLGHAPQTALAVSLRSSFAGPTGRGRFFVPIPTHGTVATDLLISEANRDACATAARTFVQSVNSVLAAKEVGLRVVIASGGSLVKGLEPTVHTVTEIGVGRALDTIRTRRNSLSEVMEYQTI